jgi:microsomal dipeptidase-like Zn-dependent dipeptidase
VQYKDLTHLAPDGVWDLIALMERAGYEETAIAGIMRENYVRISSAAWR